MKRKVVFEHDIDPDMSWLEQWNTPTTYRGNEVIIDGRKLPFDEYMRTVGNPDNHTMLCMLVYELPEDADDWVLVDSLGSIDFVDDSEQIGTFYRLQDIKNEYQRELAKGAGLL
jgi:hypothetical protein